MGSPNLTVTEGGGEERGEERGKEGEERRRGGEEEQGRAGGEGAREGEEEGRDEYRSRVLSVFRMLALASVPGGDVLFGVLTDRLVIWQAIAVSSVGLLVCWILLNRRSKLVEIGRASCRERVSSLCRSRWSPYH